MKCTILRKRIIAGSMAVLMIAASVRFDSQAMESEDLIIEEAVEGGVYETGLAGETVMSGSDETDLPDEYVEGEVICYAGSREEAEEIASQYGYLKDYGYCVATIGLTGMNVEEAIEASGGLLEANEILTLEDCEPGSPSDSVDSTDAQIPIGENWQTMYWEHGYNDPALNPESGNFQWMHEEVNSYAAWGVTLGAPTVTVAVLDTGVLAGHEDLPNVTTYDMGNGIKPRNSHATHVAGIIGAAIGNGKGGAGIAPGVNILSINVFYNEKHCSTKDVAKAIYYVAGCDENGNKIAEPRADIINMSIGGFGTNSVWENAVDAAYKAGITVVVSRGNDYSDVKKSPAACKHVISVAATDESRAKVNFSDFGPWTTVAAPGHDIYSTICNDKADNNLYGLKSGTSMATPVVAGACALYMSAYGHIAPDDMTEIVKKSVHPGTDKNIGTGILDLAVMFGGDTTPPTITNEGGFISITSMDSSTIIYTTDGKVPSVKNGQIVQGEVYTDKIPVDELGKLVKQRSTLKISAIAVSGMGTVSKCATLNLEVDPNTGEGKAETISIEGASYITAGSTTKYKVSGVVPVSYEQKDYGWIVTDPHDEAVDGVSINAGILKVDKKVAPGTVLSVRAYAEDAFGEVLVTVGDKISSLAIDTDNKDNVYNVVKKKGSIASLRLFTANIDDGGELDEHAIILNARALNAAGADTLASVTWSTGNVKVVDVIPTGNSVLLKATGKGSTTVKCAAPGKTTSIKVKVDVPVSDVYVTTPGESYIAYGGKSTFRASVGRTYGIPTNSKTVWEWDFVATLGGYKNGQYVTEIAEIPDIDREIKKHKLIKFSNGKLSVAKADKFSVIPQIRDNWMMDVVDPADYGMEWADAFCAIRIRARSTDGTNKMGEYVLWMVHPTNSIALYDFEYTNVDNYNGGTMDSYELDYNKPLKNLEVTGLDTKEFMLFSGLRYYDAWGKKYSNWDPDFPNYNYDFSVTSSNTNIATAGFLWATLNEDTDNEFDIPVLAVVPEKKGTVTLTIKALDGTGFTRKVKLRIK